MIDLSSYDFTDNYVESRLQDVSDDGAIYMLPSAYSCIGIIYNKTLLEEHGWELPKSFTDLEKLAEEAKASGVQLCLAQIAYPGYGFQYMCNIADTGFLGTFQGKQWQKDYLTGKVNVSDTQGMMDCMEYIQKWKDLGMFTTNEKDPQSDDETRNEFIYYRAVLYLYLRKERRKGKNNFSYEKESENDRGKYLPKDHFFCNSIVSGKSVSANVQYC